MISTILFFYLDRSFVIKYSFLDIISTHLVISARNSLLPAMKNLGLAFPKGARMSLLYEYPWSDCHECESWGKLCVFSIRALCSTVYRKAKPSKIQI